MPNDTDDDLLPFDHLNDNDFYSALHATDAQSFHGPHLNFDDFSEAVMPSFIFNTDSFDTDIDPDRNMDILRDFYAATDSTSLYFSSDVFANNNLFNCSSFSIVHHNVRSFSNVSHYNESCAMFANSNVKVIGFSETWLTPNNRDLYKINGYNAVHRTRVSKRGGGVSLFVH